MENMEEEPPTPPSPTSPFWIQPTTRSRHRIPSPALFLSSGFLVVVLCISAIGFLVLVVPSLLSLSHQVFRPNSVRKGWDSLNLVLVLFAVVCGFIGRKDHQEQKDQDLDNSFNVSTSQSPLSSHHQYDSWYDYEYCENVSRIHYESRGLGNVTTLRRTSSSYPDLRQEISWDVEYDHRPRYYDDSYATNEIRPPRSLRSIGSFRSRRGVDGNEEVDHSGVKEIGMDTVTRLVEKEVTPSSPPAPPLLSPPPPPTPPMYYSRIVRKPPRKEYETIAKRGNRKAKEPPPPPPSPPIVKARPPPPPPAPPPPQPPSPPLDRHEWDNTRKKGAKSVTKDILTSIYHQSKRKNKLLKRKSHENLKDLRPPLPPPPPPPPPPPSKLHNIFSSKKPKSGKKITSSFTKSRSTTPKATEFDDHETTDSGYESQAIPIPPPPPPPPFKLPPWKFVVHGDYIKITGSPKSGGGRGSDESEFEDGYSTTSSPVAGNAKRTAFCPSPDVNTKADDFIARFKATLKLEKINSGIGLSPLGPDSSPSLSPSPSPSPHAMAVSGSF